MTRGQLKNTINNIQSNMAHQRPTAASPEYSNRAEAQENDLKPNLMNILEAFKEEMNR